ncbi:MAG: hypothetical protein CME78_12280 [Halomonas sp.]|nr:hypothetical protein [Halomonas sp.]
MTCSTVATLLRSAGIQRSSIDGGKVMAGQPIPIPMLVPMDGILDSNVMSGSAPFRAGLVLRIAAAGH